MKKNAKNSIVGIIIFFGVVGFIFFGKSFFEKDERDFLIQIWMIESGQTEYVLIWSHDQRKVTRNWRNFNHITVLNLNKGETIGNYEIETKSFDELNLLCYNHHHLWIKLNKEFTCLSFPELRVQFNHEDFEEKILSAHPEVEDIYTLQWNENLMKFYVENSQGKEYYYSPNEFSNQKKTKYKLLSNELQLGANEMYTVFDRENHPSISISLETTVDKENTFFDSNLNLEEKLNLNETFAKNYAVITPDTTCLLLDQNKRRILKKLVNSDTMLIWNELLEGKVWINGEFLRPFKNMKEVPDNRNVINIHQQVFVFSHSSIDTKKDQPKLTGINYANNQIIWDLELSNLGIDGTYHPFRNVVYKNSIISVWYSSSKLFYLTSINAENGTLNWLFEG